MSVFCCIYYLNITLLCNWFEQKPLPGKYRLWKTWLPRDQVKPSCTQPASGTNNFSAIIHFGLSSGTGVRPSIHWMCNLPPTSSMAIRFFKATWLFSCRLCTKENCIGKTMKATQANPWQDQQTKKTFGDAWNAPNVSAKRRDIIFNALSHRSLTPGICR